jgi:muconate cycloisomerase
MGRCTIEDTARRASKAATSGFHGIKIKCTADDPVVERVDAIQAALPGATVTLDPNERFYDFATARKMAEGLAGRGGLIFESPIPQDGLELYSALRRAIEIPVALHLLDPKTLLNAIAQEAADVYNLSTGSPTEFVFCAHMCEVAGHSVWHGSRVDLGILDMAHVHAAAAAPACTMPSDIVGNLLREDDLIVEPIAIEDGQAIVPDRPGLGVELDLAALERYAIDTGGRR